MVRKKSKFTRKRIYFALEAVLVICIVAFLLIHNESAKNSTIIPSTNASSSAKSNTVTSSNGSQTPSSSNNSTGSATASQPDKVSSNITNSGSGPVKPFGTFISNHSVSLSGSSDQLTEESVCNTTAGATCSIQLVMGSATKQLQAQTVDNSNSTYWNWNVKDAGLSPGTWQVTVIASLNGQTQSATDSLTVQP